jgi:hypothetical protein
MASDGKPDFDRAEDRKRERRAEQEYPVSKGRVFLLLPDFKA